METRVRKIILATLAVLVILMLTGCALKDFKIKRKAQIADTDMDEIDKALQEIEKVSELIESDDQDVPLEEMKTQNPQIDASGLPIKEITEGDLVSFPNLKATDPDGDTITYTFTSPLDKNGKWQTKEGDAGQYKVTITASDGKNKVNQEVFLIVKALNRPPVIELEETTVSVKEGEKVEIRAKATDPDGDQVKVTYTGWMLGPIKTTDFRDAGDHKVIITASDGKETVQEEVIVSVQNVNRAPKLDPITDIVLKEGDRITIKPIADDPDGDRLTLGLWQTKEGDAGKYRITLTASDGILEDSTSFHIVVESLNKAPVIELAEDTIEAEEGDIIHIDATITDPENDEMTVTYKGWMTTDTYTTDYEDAGTHQVIITATDGINTATEEVTIIVSNVNRPPTFESGAFD
jgi:hypothetical protein